MEAAIGRYNLRCDGRAEEYMCFSTFTLYWKDNVECHLIAAFGHMEWVKGATSRNITWVGDNELVLHRERMNTHDASIGTTPSQMKKNNFQDVYSTHSTAVYDFASEHVQIPRGIRSRELHSMFRG